MGEWFETDFVDFWTKDFVNFWEEDFVDFWTEDLPNGIDIALDWTENALEDVGEWFETDFVEFWEEDFVDFWVEDVPEATMVALDWLDEAALDVYEGLEDAVEWIVDLDNWQAAFDTLTSSIGLLFQGEWEESWDLFTNPDAYLGEYHDELELKEKMKEYAKQMLKQNHDECALLDIPVGGRTSSGYTVTSDFNYEMRQRGIPDAAIYTPLGSIKTGHSVHITARDCESVDCMHPCYGHDMMGACNKCVMHMM